MPNLAIIPPVENNLPYTPPHYAGFWIRVAASLIDSILILVVIAPILMAIYGKEYWLKSSPTVDLTSILINYIFPFTAIVTFWIFRSATPGKLMIHTKIVDASTGKKPTTGQFIIRYIGYYISMLPLFLGIIWVGLDKRKQGWHDKIAGTVVIFNHNNKH